MLVRCVNEPGVAGFISHTNESGEKVRTPIIPLTGGRTYRVLGVLVRSARAGEVVTHIQLRHDGGDGYLVAVSFFDLNDFEVVDPLFGDGWELLSNSATGVFIGPSLLRDLDGVIDRLVKGDRDTVDLINNLARV
jgi:hypothetical protein